VPETVLLIWFQEHLSESKIDIRSLMDIFNDGYALCALINRFRPDIVELPLEFGGQKSAGNEFAFESLHEEYKIPMVRAFDLLKASFI
jgi:hypothetical protein